jgi:polycomb protein EED
VLWSIEGFSSKDPPPLQSTAPTAHDPSRVTRSAFSNPVSPAGPAALYTRLLHFHTPGCGPQFFMRFRIHHVPDEHHVLAFCNATGKIFFWDFERFKAYLDFAEAYKTSVEKNEAPPPRPAWLQQTYTRKGPSGDSLSRAKEASDMESVDTGSASASMSVPPVSTVDEDLKSTKLLKDFSQDTVNTWESKYNVDSPHRHLKAHKVESLKMPHFVGRQVGWSPDGQWCVVVGSANLAMVLHRWAKK